MLLLDASILVVLFVVKPSTCGDKTGPSPRRCILGVIPAIILAGWAYHSHTDDLASVRRSDQAIEFLIADMLVGKPWPLTDQYHPKLGALKNGNWMVVIARTDCDHCGKLIEEHFSDAASHREGERTAILLAGSNTWKFQLDEVSLKIDSNEAVHWESEPFVASPAIFLVSDGKVTSAADGDAASQFAQQLFTVGN